MSQSPFQKFVPKKKNSLIKEEFKQAKKKAKKARAIAIDKRFEEKRQLKAAARNAALQPPAAPVKSVKQDRSATSGKINKVKAIETNFDQVQKIVGIKKEYAPEPVKVAPRIVRPSSQVTAEMPLNKFIAHCGVCSRRDAVTI
jgi:23S rRNA pseudouridine2605 synthase